MGYSKMQTFTLRLNDAFKKKIEQRAKAEHKSMNQAVNDLINVGILIDELTDESSKVVIRNAKGFEPGQEVIVPVQQIL